MQQKVKVKNNVTYKPQVKNSTHVLIKDGNSAHSKSQVSGTTVHKQQHMF